MASNRMNGKAGIPRGSAGGGQMQIQIATLSCGWRARLGGAELMAGESVLPG